MKVTIQNHHLLIKDILPLKKDWDIQLVANNQWHILYKNHSFNLQLLQVIPETKTIEWNINHKIVQTQYHSELDLLLQSLGLNNASTAKIKELKSPMPGLIKKILVKPGDSVEKGDGLLTLEAMKMENILKAPANLTIQQIKVSEGNAVDKNQVLIVFG